MKRPLNVLIVDDNRIIGDAVEKRLFRASAIHSPITHLEVNPIYLKDFTVDANAINAMANQIASAIAGNEIDVLLLDRGLFKIIDPQWNPEYKNLDHAYLYGERGDTGTTIEAVLNEIDPPTFKRIICVVVYTYIQDAQKDEPERIKMHVAKAMKMVDKGAITVIATKEEIYKDADLKLYDERPVTAGLNSLGLKGQFILYGTFMGELLYHYILKTVKIRRQEAILAHKKVRRVWNLALFYVVVTGTTLGANGMWDWIKESWKDEKKVTACAIFAGLLGIILPLLILLTKPELLISVDDDNSPPPKE